MTVRVFTDGACQPNPGSMGVGVVIEWNGKKPTIHSRYIGEGTNNIAEYSALIQALGMIKEEVIKDVVLKSDSNLMVNQVNGNWKCKDESLKVLCFKAQKRINWLKVNGYKVELEYIPREFNLADEPAKLGAEEGKRLKQK